MITDHLINVASKEGYTIDSESNRSYLMFEGSMRDSLSILDNVLARNKKLPDLVRNVIGLTDNNQALDLFESLCNGEVKLSLKNFKNSMKREYQLMN